MVTKARKALRKAVPASVRAPQGRPKALAPWGEASRSDASGGDETRDELDHVFAVVARYFGVLSEPTRLKILHTICQSERSVSAIVEETGATQTNVSRHLGLMLNAGVVSRRREGNTVYYRVANPEFVEICRSVCVQIASRIDDQKPLRKDLLHFAANH